MKTQKQIPVTSYKASGFTEKYQNIVHSTVIPYQYSVLWDKADGAEKSHVAANFINAAKALRGEDPGDGFYGMVFQDSDAYKWLEAAAYAVADKPDENLERQADELIDLIADAQDKDAGQICSRVMNCTARDTSSKPPALITKQRESESFLILP